MNEMEVCVYVDPTQPNQKICKKIDRQGRKNKNNINSLDVQGLHKTEKK